MHQRFQCFGGKKAQTGALFLVFGLIVFGLVWITGLAPMLSSFGQTAITTGNLSPFQSFFFGNINLIIGICYIIAWVVIVRWGF